jgi:MraZ protein
MFLGEYQHSLDAKGRVILPARFRGQLEGGAVMAQALDGCLAVYPRAEFEDRVAAKLIEVRGRGSRERAAVMSYAAGAHEFMPDTQGRVAIPNKLREYAGLEREIVVVGGIDHVQIWDAQRFRNRDAEGIASMVAGEGIDDFM